MSQYSRSRINRENIVVLSTATIAVMAVLAIVGFYVPSAVSLYVKAWHGFIALGSFVFTLLLVILFLVNPGLVGFFAFRGLLKADEKMGDDDHLTGPVIAYAMIAGGLLWAVINQLILIVLSMVFNGFRSVVGWVADPRMLSEAPFTLWGFILWALIAYLIGWWLSNMSSDV